MHFFNPTGVPLKRKICLTSSKAKDAIGTSITVCVPKFVTVAARVYTLVLLYRVANKIRTLFDILVFIIFTLNYRILLFQKSLHLTCIL